LHSRSPHKQLLHGARDKDYGEGRVVMSPVLQLRQHEGEETKPVGMSGIIGLMLPAVLEGDLARG